MKKLIRRCASMGAVFLLTGCIITAAAAGLGGSLPGYRFHPLRGLFLLEERADDFFDSLEDRLDQIFDRDIWNITGKTKNTAENT